MAIHGKSRDKVVTALRTESAYSGGSALTIGHVFKGWGRYEGDKVNPSDVRTWVYSYGTPIAWVTKNGEVVNPDQSYSVTTSGHQGLARCYLAVPAPSGGFFG